MIEFIRNQTFDSWSGPNEWLVDLASCISCSSCSDSYCTGLKKDITKFAAFIIIPKMLKAVK